jgi:gamma-glutamyltranspeptidase/glutathione hydrolase
MTRPSRARVVSLTVAGLLALGGAAVGVTQTRNGPSATPFGQPTAENPDPSAGIAAVAGDRASNWGAQKRSEVLARNGMVATSHPLAAQAGLQMLQRGGNAADAAVAAAAAAAVVEPLSTNLGADMFALYWSAKDKRLYGLNASGWAPKAWTREYFRRKGHDAETGMPLRGPDSITVPGAIDGWDRLLDRFGTMGFRQVLEPAAELADDGFGLTEREHSDWKPWVQDLKRDPETARTWLVDGKVPPLYGVFRNRDMARAFRVLQRQGRDAFYEGRSPTRSCARSVTAAGR